MRCATGTFSCATVAALITPSGVEAVPPLKALHRLLKVRAVGRRLCVLGAGVVPGHGQSLREHRDRRVLLAGLQLQLRGDRRPAAALLDLPVAGQRVAQGGVLRMMRREIVERAGDLVCSSACSRRGSGSVCFSAKRQLGSAWESFAMPLVRSDA